MDKIEKKIVAASDSPYNFRYKSDLAFFICSLFYFSVLYNPLPTTYCTLPLLRLATWSTVGPCSPTPPWGWTGSSVVRNQSKDNPDYSSMPYKYAERNGRGLALVVTDQERSDVDNIDLDNVKRKP